MERRHLITVIEKLDIDSSANWLIILPGLGCPGCIQEGEAFMNEYVKDNSILFVLTNLSSLKILQHKIGINIKDHKNIFVDRKNEFKVPTNNGIYPCIVKIKNGRITDFEFQCPDNGQAFAKLKHQIKEQKI